MAERLFWGDLHNHCGISYGHGSLEAALARARGQLDFASVTGHAFWPDMPTDREQHGHLIEFHEQGFARLAEQWDEVLAAFERHHEPGRFVTFGSYEWHSRASGDQVVLLKHPAGPLVGGETIDELWAAQTGRESYLYPHHVGYLRGFRGINWDDFDPERSPLVEVHSMHGCSESDEAPFPMLHTMGPRDHDGTIQAGLARGHRFGFAGGTDHHSAYPGSWGDGRVAIVSEELTRDALWDAIEERRTYAVTGDKIGVDVRIDGAPFGSVIPATPKHQVRWTMEACDFIDTVELIKNNHVAAVWNGPLDLTEPLGDPVVAKVRVEWGWGKKDRPTQWQGRVSLTGGKVLGVETCFRGAPVLAPTAGHEDETLLPHELISSDDNGCTWRSETYGNPTTRHATTQALILTVEMNQDQKLRFGFNDTKFEHTLAELLAGARAHYLKDLESAAIRIHRAVPHACYAFAGRWTDVAGAPGDFYYLRIRQRNGQAAWVTPLWVE